MMMGKRTEDRITIDKASVTIWLNPKNGIVTHVEIHADDEYHGVHKIAEKRTQTSIRSDFEIEIPTGYREYV